jgi:hypothetical protein
MCKEMLVIPVNRVVDKKRIIGKNGGPRRRTGTRGHRTPPFYHIHTMYIIYTYITYMYAFNSN